MFHAKIKKEPHIGKIEIGGDVIRLFDYHGSSTCILPGGPGLSCCLPYTAQPTEPTIHNSIFSLSKWNEIKIISSLSNFFVLLFLKLLCGALFFIIWTPRMNANSSRHKRERERERESSSAATIDDHHSKLRRLDPRSVGSGRVGSSIPSRNSLSRQGHNRTLFWERWKYLSSGRS